MGKKCLPFATFSPSALAQAEHGFRACPESRKRLPLSLLPLKEFMPIWFAWLHSIPWSLGASLGSLMVGFGCLGVVLHSCMPSCKVSCVLFSQGLVSSFPSFGLGAFVASRLFVCSFIRSLIAFLRCLVRPLLSLVLDLAVLSGPIVWGQSERIWKASSWTSSSMRSSVGRLVGQLVERLNPARIVE